MRIGKDLIPMNKLVVLAVIFLITGFKHPMHISVMEIEFDQKSKAIEMSMHVFIDDLDEHIKSIEKNDTLDLLEVDAEVRNRLLKVYFLKNIEVTANEKLYTTNYLGHEIEGDAFWVYLEVEDVKKLKSLSIKNTVLVDAFDDQANLIHFEYENDTYSQKLDKKEIVANYDLDDL